MFLDQSVQVSFRWIRSDLHFSPGLGLSLVCETGGNYLGTEHQWCEDPLESAPFTISQMNRIFEGLNMLEKSRNFAHASELVKIYIWYVFQK